MARGILLLGAAVWSLVGLAGLVTAAFGIEALRPLLPELAIGIDSLARTVAALGVGLLILAAVHGVVIGGLGGGHRWAASVGVLLAAVMAVGFVALVAAAITSVAAGTMAPVAGLPAGAVAALIATGYGLAGARLIRVLRSESAS